MRRLALLLVAGGVLTGAALAVRWCVEQAAGPPIPLPDDLGDLEADVAQLIGGAALRIQDQPQNADAWRELGMVYDANGMIDLATACYSNATTIDPSNGRAWYHLGLVQTTLGDSEHALASMGKAIERGPDFAPPHWRSGFLRLDRGEFEEAEAAFGRAIQLDPQHPAAHIGLARIHLQRQENQQAAAVLGGLLQRPGPIENQAYIHQLLAISQQRLGHEAEAETARRRAPGSPGSPGGGGGGSGGSGGWAAPVWSDPWADEAARYWTGAAAALQRAQMLAAQRRYDEALALLADLRQRHPQRIAVLLTLAACYREQQRFEESLRTLEEAERVGPDSGFVHANFALTYLAQSALAPQERKASLHESAWRHAELARQANPALALAHGVMGDVHLACGRNAEAARSFTAAAGCDREAGPWLFRAASAHCQAGAWQEAIGPLEHLTRASPEHADAWRMLGLAHDRLGHAAEAERAFSEAVRVGGGDDPRTQRALIQPQESSRLGPRAAPTPGLEPQ